MLNGAKSKDPVNISMYHAVSGSSHDTSQSLKRWHDQRTITTQQISSATSVPPCFKGVGLGCLLNSFKCLLYLLHRIPQHHRPSMRTAHGTLRLRQLPQQPFHFV